VTLFHRSAVRDGDSSDDFHSRCDDKGATFVLIQSEGGYIFGGFASASWTDAYCEWSGVSRQSESSAVRRAELVFGAETRLPVSPT
jgi:hypothetical protein